MLVGQGDELESKLPDLQRAVLDAAERVAAGRRSGSLTADDLDRLAEADEDYRRHRRDYLRMV